METIWCIKVWGKYLRWVSATSEKEAHRKALAGLHVSQIPCKKESVDVSLCKS